MHKFTTLRWQALVILPVFFIITSNSMTNAEDSGRNHKLESVVVSDGINAAEAEILSAAYFHKFVSGCGYVSKPVDAGDHWLIEMHISYTGELAADKIVINKKNGSISLRDHPTVTDPLTDLKSEGQPDRSSKTGRTQK